MNRINRQRRSSRTRPLTFQAVEPRRVMAASAMEIYALSVVNQVRADPPAFGTALQGMIDQTVDSAHGYAASDPVWTDLRDAISVSLTPSNVAAAIDLLQSTDPLPPLTWEDSLQAKSAVHNDWMQNHCFTHSTPAGASALPCFAALPGLTYNPQGAAANPDIISAETMGPWSSGSYSENIGYQSGPSMPRTRAAHAVGSVGHRQRQAYYDIVNFVLEFNSSSLGHLEALLQDRRDAIGIDYALLDGFSNTSSATNFLATHTLSRNKDFGGYLTGLAYTDSNQNGLYDVGEHTGGCVTVLDIAAGTSTEHCVAAGDYGRLSVFLPAGQYQVTGGATTIAVDIGYVSENQNVDVTAALNDTTVIDQPLDLTGYQALFSSSVVGTHQLSGNDPYHVLMFDADRDATLSVQPSSAGATPTSQQVFVVDESLIDISTTDAAGVTADVVAGGRYAIVFLGSDQIRSFDVSVSPGDGVRLGMTNLIDFADVNGDGDVSPLDALNVINELARRQGPSPSDASFFYDVNQDDDVTPRDALNVINEIARRSAPGEPESPLSLQSPLLTLSRWRPSTNDGTDEVMNQIGLLF
ncbi:Dockerin type I repeat protein [Stieleria maiorica]|uniref:Dockerin type I repeat protein n=1 Tax=Stieleria maiorica TaxID=2795974 RepID=A0A5B9M9Y8_9BACT|nr:dockerin type I domain-containing protein [Stieleria maiorica]QEF96345.1 Dockerin type I repeat protein [Stieleria maiorica]